MPITPQGPVRFAWGAAELDRPDRVAHSETGQHFIMVRHDGSMVVGSAAGTVWLPAGAAQRVADCRALVAEGAP